MTARLVFHLPARHLGDWRTVRHLALFQHIEAHFGARGARIVVCDRRERPYAGGATEAYADGDLHILDTGRATGPGVLNASIAYLLPFWHLDPRGMQAESSIALRRYDPAEVPGHAAQSFFARMRLRYTLKRRSRRAQEDAVTRFPPGAISVFLQGDRPEVQGLAYLSGEAMLRAVAEAAGGRPVLVKPHPLAAGHDAEVIARVLADGVKVTPTTANVVDMIAASDATVSVNSACAIEGFLQGKPAVLCGPSDFHHVAETVTRADQFGDALARALARSDDPAAFLYWYFGQCLRIGDPKLPERILQVFAGVGFDADRLGLDAPAP